MISDNLFIIIIIVFIILLLLIDNKEMCNETFDNDNEYELKNKINNFDFIIKYDSFN